MAQTTSRGAKLPGSCSSDQGGLVYQPVTGLHRHVAELDFISMYPSIMVHYNISPETIRGPVNLNERLAAPPDNAGYTTYFKAASGQTYGDQASLVDIKGQ